MEQQIQKIAKRSTFSNSAISSHLYKLSYPEKSINSMLKCGEENGSFIYKSCNCGQEVINLSHKCNLRTCPTCSKTRKRRIRRQYLPFFKNLAQNRTYFLYFLTISPKNYDNLAEGIAHVKKSFSKFLRLKYIRERVKAGLYVIESKKGDKGWNVHIHAIIYGRYLDVRARGLCLDCNQNLLKKDHISNKFYCANRKCNSQNVILKEKSGIIGLFEKSAKRPANIHISRLSSSSFALNYMLKYISANKEDFQTPEDMAEYIFVTHKKKLINTFGLFYNLKVVKTPCICSKCEGYITFHRIEELFFCNQTIHPPNLLSH
jgi:hypothetical protein